MQQLSLIFCMVMTGLLTGLPLSAQGFSESAPEGELSARPDAALHYKGSAQKGDYLVLSYSIPYQGMVEFRLFDDNKALVWRKQEVRDPGEHQLVLRKSAFREGISYSCRFNYKEDEVNETLLLP